MNRRLILAFFLLVGSLSFKLQAAELQVYAAASLTDAMQEIGSNYSTTSGDTFAYNFGASSLLERQIEEGAPADLFFSADEEKMDSLDKKHMLLENSRKSLLSNSLVIVVPNDSNVTLKSAMDLKSKNWKIAMAEPQTVPAGIYAKSYLKKIGIWSNVIDRVIPTENVRAALSAVESGNVDVGIVYKTDAQISKRVKIAFEVPLQEGPKISYPLAVIKGSKNVAAAKKFADYLSTSEANAVFQKYGFLLIGGN